MNRIPFGLDRIGPWDGCIDGIDYDALGRIVEQAMISALSELVADIFVRVGLVPAQHRSAFRAELPGRVRTSEAKRALTTSSDSTSS